MKRIFFAVCCWLFLLGGILADSEDLSAQEKIKLNPEEKAWIQSNPVIRVHNEKDWPPFNFFEEGSPRGFSIDYMNLVASITGLKVEYVTGPAWSEFLEMMKSGDLDVMLNIVKTPGRQQYLLYTKPYAFNPNSILSLRDAPYDSLEQLFGKTVALPKGFFYEEILKRDYPRIKLHLVKDVARSMKAVLFGKADAAFGELAVFTYLMEREMMTGLVVSGEVKLGGVKYSELQIAVRKESPVLASILLKAMEAVDPDEMRKLRQRWLAGAKTASPQTSNLQFVGYLLFAFVSIFFLLFALSYLLMRSFKNEEIALRFGSKWFRAVVLSSLGILIVVVLLMAWIALDFNKDRTLAGVRNSLRDVLQSTSVRLEIWLEQRKIDLRQIGRDPELLEFTTRLLKVSGLKSQLQGAESQITARKFFAENINRYEAEGFLVIAPNNETISSTWDLPVGKLNPISEYRQDLIDRAFSGESVFLLPGHLREKNSAETLPAKMFFLAPIQGADGKVLAVLAMWVDPRRGFSRVLQLSRIQNTDESYAFDKKGRLLSESRFNDHLRQIGLINAGESSILNIEVRDPGGNMVEGFRPATPRDEQPLTLMAAQATKGKNGVNVSGYRDYRGVQVLGAWRWNENLGLGLTSEIDVDEALSIYYTTRNTVAGILSITLLLAIGAVLFTLVLGERSNQALSRARDTLELRVAERTEELELKDHQLSTALESMTDGICMLDKDLRIVIINDQHPKLTSIPKELYGIGDSIEVSTRALARKGAYGTGPIEEAVQKRMQDYRSETVTRTEVPIKDGDRFVESMIAPIAGGGSVLLTRDITERKKSEAVLEEAYQIIKGQKDRMEAELNIGREIQMNMIPLIFPPFPKHDEFQIFGALEPAREVGGDFYNFFFIDEERFCFCVGDVAGKGVPSALFMAVTTTLIKSRASDDRSTASIVNHLNSELSRNNPTCMFVTLFLAILNIHTGEMLYTNAGHNPPIIRRKEGAPERLAENHGPPVGALEDVDFAEASTQLASQDLVLLYTDGVTEEMDADGNLFSEARLYALVNGSKAEGPEELLREVLASVEDYRGDTLQSDDVTLLALQYLVGGAGESVVEERMSITNNLREIGTVSEWFDAFATRRAMPQVIRANIQIALDEVLNNIISYAFRDEAPHEIEVRVKHTSQRLSVTIADDGVAFNPLAIKEPEITSGLEERQIGGLGVHLVRNLMDEVTYHRRIGSNFLTLVVFVGRNGPS